MTASQRSTLTVRRQLTRSQQARRQRILEAATQLAARGGYEAVMMKDVAQRAAVSLGTVYRYFASKDHLLACALEIWGRRLSRRLEQAPPRAGGPAERVAAVFALMARGVERQPELGVALTRALLSQDPSALDNRDELRDMMRGWIDTALGDADIPDRDGVTDVLQHVSFSSMVSLALGRASPSEVGRELERATRLLLAGGGAG